jgi:hypothetical protein
MMPGMKSRNDNTNTACSQGINPSERTDLEFDIQGIAFDQSSFMFSLFTDTYGSRMIE